MKIALLGILAVSVALILIVQFLLKDFVKFLRVKLKFYNILPRTFVDLGQYSFTFFTVIMVSFLGLVCLKSFSTLFSYLLAGDLVDFYRLVRGVYSPEITDQTPFKTSHLISALIFNPVSQLVTVFLMTTVLRNFFQRVNKMFNDTIYSESDTLIYGLLSGIILVIIEILLYSQNITLLSNIAHVSYLVISKLSILLYFIAISHAHLLNSTGYKESLHKYLDISGSLQKLTYSKYGMVLISLSVGITLSIPFYLGTQFLNNNFVLIIILIAIIGLVVLIYRAGITKALNCLGFVLLSEQYEGLIHPQLNRTVLKRILLLIGITALIFILFNFASFFMGLTLFILLLMSIYLGYNLVYGLGVLVSVLRTKFLDLKTPNISFKNVHKVSFLVFKHFLRSGAPVFVIAWSVFMLISFAPHSIDYQNRNVVKAVIDEDGHVLLSEESDANPTIVTGSEEIPEFLVTCLLLQEDRDFMYQRDVLPNSLVKISNWHGLSLASVYRILTGSGGGSNCNMQILKNLGTNGRAQDLQRKITEFYSAYQLSLSHTPEEILNYYLNTVAFNGGYGHSGIIQAAHHTFNRPISHLNELEMMYLIRTVIGGTFVVVDNEKILCKDAPAHPEEIKTSLLRIATSWKDQGLISETKFNQLKIQDLKFEEAKANRNIQTTTREFIKKVINDDSSPDQTLISSISVANQLKVDSAVTEFRNHLKEKNNYKDHRLFSAALAVDISSGRIIGHHGGSGVTDLTDFQSGFPMASTIKPVILLQALEEGILQESSTLFDGAKDKNTPENYKKYSKKEMNISDIISESPNAPLYNLKHLTNSVDLFRKVEGSFEAMKLSPDNDLKLSVKEEKYSIERNYPLGELRRMPIQDIAQVYQTIFNDGIYVKLNSIQETYNAKTGKKTVLSGEKKKIFETKNCQVIKNGLAETVKSGTAKRLTKFLPKGKAYFAKTGTSNGFIHGYTILSDGETLVVAWVSYGKETEGRIEFNDTPAIPFNSGGGSAGVLAANILAHLSS